MRLTALGLAALLAAPAARAEEIEFDPAQPPYAAVGKLNVVTGAGRRQFCTASLLGPRLVLTAAHCLWDNLRGRWVNPGQVHFVAGWASGSYAAHATARGFETAPGYVYGTERASLGADWALVSLSEPMALPPLALAGAESGVPDEVARAGYDRLRSERMSLHAGCAARLEPGEPPLLLHACRAIPGESGSALLRTTGGRAEVVGVLVAGRRPEGPGQPSVAVPVAAFRARAEALLAAPGG